MEDGGGLGVSADRHEEVIGDRRTTRKELRRNRRAQSKTKNKPWKKHNLDTVRSFQNQMSTVQDRRKILRKNQRQTLRKPATISERRKERQTRRQETRGQGDRDTTVQVPVRSQAWQVSGGNFT